MRIRGTRCGLNLRMKVVDELKMSRSMKKRIKKDEKTSSVWRPGGESDLPGL